MGLGPWLSRALLVLSLLFVAQGCGPGASTLYISRAEVALGVAETAGAKRFARYEWAKARAYLEKAKEEQAYSDFAASRDYAKKAAILAEIAKKKSKVEMRIDGNRPLVEESNQ